MNVASLARAVVPVVLGVIIAGYLLNTFRDNEIVNQAIAGFDH